MKTKYTVIVDSREKRPLLFPSHLIVLDPTVRPSPSAVKTIRLATRVEKLGPEHPEVNRGDYYLEGYPDRVIIERKGSIDEIAMNMFRPHRRLRIIEEMKYLSGRCSTPIWLTYGSPRALLTPTRETKCPGPAMDALIDLLLRHTIMLWIVNKPALIASRRATGELAARMMIRGSLCQQPQKAILSI